MSLLASLPVFRLRQAWRTFFHKGNDYQKTTANKKALDPLEGKEGFSLFKIVFLIYWDK
jgi:hypothetical protein